MANLVVTCLLNRLNKSNITLAIILQYLISASLKVRGQQTTTLLLMSYCKENRATNKQLLI